MTRKAAAEGAGATEAGEGWWLWRRKMGVVLGGRQMSAAGPGKGRGPVFGNEPFGTLAPQLYFSFLPNMFRA